MSKKVDIELPNEESGAGSPQQPASPESEHDNKGDVSGAATKSTLKKKKGSASGVVKSFPEKSSASGVVKSFSESLAARPERSLAETYRVEEGIPDNVIEWSLKCFAYFDAATSSWSKDILKDPLLDDIDLWELRESLFLGGKEVTDELVVDMIRSVGKVEHANVRINFREFVRMCWKWFFEEPKEDTDLGDVRDAFEILGGGPGKEGVVEKQKLKDFATDLNLTIDVDKFVGEVDVDGSGKVDYEEFCKLFADCNIDTNLHDTGQVWLRQDKDEIVGKHPAGGGRGVSPSKRSLSPTSLVVETDEKTFTAIDSVPEGPTTTTSRPDSAYFDGRSHEQAASMTWHRDGFFGDEASPHMNSAVLHAPKMKKVLQSALPKFERKPFHNTVDTKCRRGWRCSQLNRNNPQTGGYNFYNIKQTQFQELTLPIPGVAGSKGVKIRKRGAEYTIKEHSSWRINVRLSSEMRCLRYTKHAHSRPSSCAMTELGGTLSDSRLMTANSWQQPASRAQTAPADGGVGARGNRAVLGLSVATGSGRYSDMRSRVERQLGGSTGLTSSWGSSTMGTTRNYSYKNASRDKAWLSNMKTCEDTLPTSDLLKLAASAGMYDGRGFQKDVGPGISFFDNSP